MFMVVNGQRKRAVQEPVGYAVGARATLACAGVLAQALDLRWMIHSILLAYVYQYMYAGTV